MCKFKCVTAWLEQEKLDAERRRLEETPEDEYDVLSVFCTVTHGAVSVYSVL